MKSIEGMKQGSNIIKTTFQKDRSSSKVQGALEGGKGKKGIE